MLVTRLKLLTRKNWIIGQILLLQAWHMTSEQILKLHHWVIREHRQILLNLVGNFKYWYQMKGYENLFLLFRMIDIEDQVMQNPNGTVGAQIK